MVCPECNFPNPSQYRFCGVCGKPLDEQRDPRAIPDPEGERRLVTVLFTDLTGYTTMCERLDPEDVQEVMSRIFGEIAQVVAKQGGLIEKFVGDAAMALFGVPKAHEDDPVRAIKAAMEIHGMVEALSPQVRVMGCRPLSMHTGICTGLVVTGGVDAAKGATGVTGDTVNMACRLSGMGKAEEILVGPYTYCMAEGYFDFEELESTTVEGKMEPVRIYRVLSRKDQPSKIHRLSGLRSELIGRNAEMAQLSEAVEKLREGKGSIIGICGDAGTGKSRLVEEFKATLNLREIKWREGHAYAYSQNIPYFPITDILRRALRIEEGDSPPKIREKVERRIGHLFGRREDFIPYIGSLFALSYPEIKGTSPDSWKYRLHKAVKEFLSDVVKNAPTVISFEDLHWADPSSIELLRAILSGGRHPALFLFMYRPPFALFPGPLLGALGDSYREIRLQDLSSSEALEMTGSLLKTGDMPLELRRFVREKTEGNPFYLEEMINTLVESDTLVRDNGSWKLSRPLRESDISPTVHGVILARLDRLEKEAKRILQEASVIGRVFMYEILKRVTEFNDHIEQHLAGLERLDLIRTRSFHPTLEYMFKHALTQEAVYNGLLKKEREILHRRIGLVMEGLFKDRLPEFYEALAFHFEHGADLEKSVEYLVKSGEKSFSRCGLEEAHNYFQQAFDLLAGSPVAGRERAEYLIDLLNRWAPVFFWRGAYIRMVDLLKSHEELAESLGSNAKAGMLFAWMGLALQAREKLNDANHYLRKALEIGERVGDERVVGYACAWLAPTCAEMGLLDDSEGFTEKAQEISRRHRDDPMLFTLALRASGYASYLRGEAGKTEGFGRVLLEQGRRESDVRCTTMGHFYVGQGRQLAGDFPSAIESYKKSMQISVEPLFSHIARLMLGRCYIAVGSLQDGETILEEALKFSEASGTEIIRSGARGLMSILLLAKGDLGRGLSLVEEALETFRTNGSRVRIAMALTLIGNVYLKIVCRKGRKGISFLLRNPGFLMKNLPYAEKKAENHFRRAIEVAQEIGAKNILAQANLGMGLLSLEMNEISKAKNYLSEAVDLFRRCEAEVYLKQAEAALASCQEISSHRKGHPAGRKTTQRIFNSR
jgi:class 3 adenylate cyclase/tetratricopeptide (TPR) repeat protein